MQGIFEVVRRVAPTNISVLIEGPSGTGKELLARAIHMNSLRRDKPFKPVNCAGLTETLLESELFGHVKGAFTGANTDRKGLFEVADKGTLFLDEIGDMPLTMQAKLLRVLEDGVVTPVGSNKATVVDVRIISATNHNLTKLIERTTFRAGPLFPHSGRERHAAAAAGEARGHPDPGGALPPGGGRGDRLEGHGHYRGRPERLVGYEWPGNIRQLKNAIRTMVVMCDRPKIDIPDLPPEISPRRQLPGTSAAAGQPGGRLPERPGEEGDRRHAGPHAGQPREGRQDPRYRRTDPLPQDPRVQPVGWASAHADGSAWGHKSSMG